MEIYKLLQPISVTHDRTRLHPSFCEQSPQSLSKEHRIVGDHDTHGSSALTRVPLVSLSTVTRPPAAAARSAVPQRWGVPLMVAISAPTPAYAHGISGDGADVCPSSDSSRRFCPLLAALDQLVSVFVVGKLAQFRPR